MATPLPVGGAACHLKAAKALVTHSDKGRGREREKTKKKKIENRDATKDREPRIEMLPKTRDRGQAAIGLKYHETSSSCWRKA